MVRSCGEISGSVVASCESVRSTARPRREEVRRRQENLDIDVPESDDQKLGAVDGVVEWADVGSRRPVR